MKLCEKAVAIRDSFVHTGFPDRAERAVSAASARADRRALAARMHRHMGKCKLCSK